MTHSLALAQTEPPHPILTITGSGSGASTILSTYTEDQYTNFFVPHQPPRNDGYGFVPAVVSGDTGWSWSASNPNQITSTPSGIVFPNGSYTVLTQAVTVMNGHTVNVPYYLKAGSSSSKSLVFALIDYKKLGQLRSDFNKLSPAYFNSGGSPASRNDAYARRIAVALLDWARWYPDYYMTAKNSASFINTSPSYILPSDLQRASDHNGLAHEWQDDELLAFDCIYDSVALTNLSNELGFDVRAYIKTNLFCNEGDFIVYHVPVSVAIQSNLSGPYTVLALVARVLNRPDYIIWMDQYLDATVRQKIRRDGVLSEGISYSVGYINENLDGAKNTKDYFLTRPADTPTLQAISNRVSSYVATLTYGQGQWNTARLPNGELPAFGDTTFGASGARNAGSSTLLPAYGHVSMGAGSASQSVQLNQNFPGDNNHMRADVTAFVLWTFNNEILGNVRYYNGTPGRQFGEQILAHNAVTIDRVNMSHPDADTYGNGDLTLYEAGNNGLALTEIDGQRAYSNKASRYQRLMLLNSTDLNRPYVVDIFRVTGGTNHDYILHGCIRFDQTWQCSFPLVTNPAPYPMLEGGEVWVEPTSSGSTFPYYGFWRNVSSNQAPGNFQITYRDTNRVSGRDLRLWMTDDGTAQVYVGMTPNPERNNNTPPNWYKYWRPSSIIRKRITGGTLQDLFVSVIEPINAGLSTIQSVERLPVSGSNLESVALRVTFTDGRVDTCIVNLRNPQVAGASGGSQTVSTADGQYVLNGRVGVHSDTATGPRVWAMNATDFQYPRRRLVTPNTYYSGLIAGEERKLTGGSNDAFISTSPLPLGTALRNKQLSLTFGTLSGSGTTGISEMFKIDQVILSNSQYYVTFTNDHQLEITNGATSVEQMAPLRKFTSSNAFEIALSAFAGQISSLADINIAPGGSSGPISFNFGNLGTTAGASLQVVATSSNPSLIPNNNLVIGGSGTNRTITVTPVPAQTGSSFITVSVTDGVWTNSRSFTALVNAFALTASPPSQTVLAGGNTTYSVTVIATNGFTNTVSFGATGVPAGASASFSPPTINGAGSSTLNVFTSNSISPGTYTLTLTANSGSLTSTTMVALAVNSIVALPGTMIWSGSNNWSFFSNWTNVTAGGYGPPGSSNDVVFGNSGAVGTSNTINNIVDSDSTINSLVFTNLTGYHTMQISPGRTLSIIGTAPGYQNSPALNVGIEGYAAANQQIRAAITGAGGTLSISNTSATVQVRVGFSNSVVGPLATLDMSGLGTFNANMNHIQLGVESGAPRRVAGVWYLARTNNITLVQADNVNANLTSGNPALYLGHNTQIGVTNGSALYLGVTNAMFVNFVVIGRGNQTNNLLAFNPAFLSNQPAAFFRASDGVGRVGIWTLGDNSAGSQTSLSSGTNDFTGGTVDAMVDLLFLGRGRVGTTANTGVGVLTFDAGTIDVNTLRLGTMVDEATSTNASGVGTVNVNGSATLVVNTALEFAHINNTAAPTAAAIAATRGTLNLNGGTVQAANVVGGGGTGTINLSSGVLDLLGGSIANLTNLNVGIVGVIAPAFLTNASSIGVLNPIAVASNGVIAGNCSIFAPRMLLNGALSPGGDTSGYLYHYGPLTLGAGGRYPVDLQNGYDQPGVDWDFLYVANGMDIQSTINSPFVIQLRTLSDSGAGPMLNFDNGTPYSWVIAYAAEGFTNYTPSRFSIDDSGFLNDLAGGYFVLENDGLSLILDFVNNQAPLTEDVTFYPGRATTAQIPIASLAPHWSDPDGDPVVVLSVNPDSTNGVNNVGTDGTYIYYTNVNHVLDDVLYTIADVRTSPPAVYRPGDTVRTAQGVIHIVPPPSITGVSVAGGNLIISGANGIPFAPFHVLASTNAALPVANWTPIAAGSFDFDGTFNLSTPVDANVSQQFYLLQLP